ncbi:inorganic pyrophosphatase-like isoform X1 [Strongylocentrotus purpuratus]|uniref:Inorganic pyrophosphatase n=1 Tax=Strongylocentrotus purpuratus TaxID=7668 RepID=A0A7M7NF62_STRPU|nr:inorganic pyrophosphatase-like isoform X1 [Strongylocentrotus purpuratus]|eukprot:XP_793193.3 PREDICTED: inorganic pyrophosphatase [Strongylocentrotus purpuratus]
MFANNFRRVLSAACHQRTFTKVSLASYSRVQPSKFQFGNFRISAMAYSGEPRGAPNSLDYRLFFRNSNGQVISPFHDIPLYADKENQILNMVVEVPRWTNAKMEIDTAAPMNPIKQDVKKGKLRFVRNCFPHHGYIWNYGAFPQTWEDPNHTDASTKCKGDNDPLDVCEIGRKVAKRGEVIQVKVLGTLAMIDEGETDWKIFAIDVTDPLAKDMNDIDDIRRLMPGFLEASVNWFKIYKVPDGKPLNEFAFNEEPKNREFAMGIVNETSGQWQKLISGESDAGKLSCQNVTVDSSKYKVSAAEAQAEFDKAAPVADLIPRDPEVDNNNHFVNTKA